jgi:hypothetical protein
VQYQPEVAFNAKCDALADSAHFFNDFSLSTFERRLHGSQEEWARHAYLLQWLTNDARFESGDVCGDIWQLGHRQQIAWQSAVFQSIACSVRDSAQDFATPPLTLLLGWE